MKRRGFFAVALAVLLPWKKAATPLPVSIEDATWTALTGQNAQWDIIIFDPTVHDSESFTPPSED